MRRWGRFVDSIDDGIVLVRPGNGEHAWKGRTNALVLDTETAGDDNAAVLSHRLTNRFQALSLRAIKEPACVHDHNVGTGVIRGSDVTLRTEPRQNPLGIDQRLRASEADETDLRRARVALWEFLLHSGEAPVPINQGYLAPRSYDALGQVYKAPAAGYPPLYPPMIGMISPVI